MAKVLVTGATGYVGGRLAPRLIEAGHDVVCLTRDARRLQSRQWGAFTTVEGSISNREILARALDGCEAAYYLIHSMDAGDGDFAERDRAAARMFMEVAEKTPTLRQIIYLGGLGDSSADLSAHLQSRHEVGEILRSGTVAGTEFRAAIVVGSGSASFEMLRWLTERLPVMVCPRWVSTRCQPIGIRDILNYLHSALLKPEAMNQVFEIGGTDVLTYKEMMLTYARLRGLKRWLIPVPVLTPRLSSLWVDLVTPIPAALARPLVLGMRNEVIVHDDRALKVFDVKPISYEEAVAFALERLRSDFHETTWHDSYAFRGQGETPMKLEVREGMIVEKKSILINASPEKVYAVIASLGGKTGWLYADALWDIRGAMDRMIGGPGMRRGRRSATEVRAGDAMDFWRVVEADPNRRLRLYAEMKLPGEGWLQYELDPEGSSTKLTQTVFFEPRGLSGQLYWMAFAIPHRFIFTGILRKIRERVMAGSGVTE